MIRTYGLTHISLAVRDIERSLRFYKQLFGATEVYRDDGEVQLQTPGSKDVIALERRPRDAGKSAGMAHFGFRLVDARDIDAAVAEVARAGGKLLRGGEFGPGQPYAYVADPDGYEIEIWYE
jgi:catechol 2,3-dioxygenase-like lactoylglutathione lyase family enzyme